MHNPQYLLGKITKRRRINPYCYQIRIALPQTIGPILPGQFAMIGLKGGEGVLLPRPFSIFSCNNVEEASWIDLIFKVIGRGTTLLSQMSIGTTIPVLAPLGNGFPDPPFGLRPVTIAGGMGIVSIVPLLKRLRRISSSPTLFYGVHTSNDLICLTDLKKLRIPIKITTEDGSKGEKGNVTQFLEEINEKDKYVIYACGPIEMIYIISKFVEKQGILCWVSDVCSSAP